jgi:hypothetical protein
MDWIAIIKNGEQRRVRPHGLELKQSQGWVVLGANQDPERSQVSPASPKKKKDAIVDSGGIVAYPVKRKSA